MVKMQSQSWGSFLEGKGIFSVLIWNFYHAFPKGSDASSDAKCSQYLCVGLGCLKGCSILFLKSWIEMSYKTLIWNYINQIFPLPM